MAVEARPAAPGFWKKVLRRAISLGKALLFVIAVCAGNLLRRDARRRGGAVLQWIRQCERTHEEGRYPGAGTSAESAEAAKMKRYLVCRFVTRTSEMPAHSADTVPELVKHLEDLEGWPGLYIVHDRQPPATGVESEVAGTITKDENGKVTWKPGPR